MIKKEIAFTNLDDKEVTQTYYFHFNKLEGTELDLEYGGLENKMKELTETEDSKQAYLIFKDILLRAVGKKSEDGNRFIKNAEIRSQLEDSPALGELIYEFFEKPELVGPFMESMLPAKDVAEGKARAERDRLIEEARKSSAADKEIAQAEEDEEKLPAEKTMRTDEEILNIGNVELLTNEELARLLTLRKSQSENN